MAQLMDPAFSVLNNVDWEGKEEQSQREKKREEKRNKLIVLAVSSTTDYVQPPLGNLEKPQKHQGQKDQICF